MPTQEQWAWGFGIAVVQTVAVLVHHFYYPDMRAWILAKLGWTSGFTGTDEPPRTWAGMTQLQDVDGQKYFDGSAAYLEGLKMGMDPAIIASHRQYTSDTDFMATHGASYASARDDFTPAVQWHGLPRRAHYAQMGSERSARVSQSETPEEVAEFQHHHTIGYKL